MRHAALTGLLALTAAASLASGRVLDATSAGFLVQHEVEVRATPAAAWRALLDVGRWWNPAHTYSGQARNLRLDARPGGCFCERLPGRGGVEHMRVLYAAPAAVLRMGGALGPLQGAGLTGSMTITLKPLPGGLTHLTLAYSVGGYMQGGVERMAPAVDAMLGEQIERLRAYIDHGPPPGGAAASGDGAG
jgi:hypothetical protein